MPDAVAAVLGKSQHSVFAETQQFFVKQRYADYCKAGAPIRRYHSVLKQGSCCARAAISKLRDDNAKLKEELLLENKFSVTPTSSNLSANIANLQDQSDVYTRKVTFHTLVSSCLSCSTCNSTRM